jgi:hypothetical protein
MAVQRAVMAAVVALIVAGCARSRPVIIDEPRLGALEVQVAQAEGRVSFRAYRRLWGTWAPGIPTPRPIFEARVARPWGRPLWRVRTADPQAAVPILPYPGRLPGYVRDLPPSGPVPALERGAKYEVWLKDGGGWRRAEFVYAPDAPAHQVSSDR